MRITGIHIYGYGKLENVKFMPFSRQIQAIFGRNEAGKSTVMSFIHSILFGFPTKQQNSKRYEPKTGLKYGGMVYLDTTMFGAISVERIKSPNKAAGNVTVTLPDGTIGGEEVLHTLFNGMDKATFQRIYSFDIHGIQKVHTIKSADLSKFLFSSGMIGTDILTSVDQMFEKELEKYFKPNGKKPFINEKLRDIKNVHHHLMKLQKHNSTYLELEDEKNRLENQLERNHQEKEILTNHVKTAELKKSLIPLYMEKSVLQHKLAELPNHEPYPIDGINRLERLKANLLPYETRKFALESKRTDIMDQLSSLTVDDHLLNSEPIINQLNSTKSLFDAKKGELSSLQTELELINQAILGQKELVSIRIHDDEFGLLNTSFTKKQHIQQVTKEYERLKNQKHELDYEFSKVKDELETSERKISELERECLNEHERRELEKVVTRTGVNENHELESVSSSLTACEQRIERTNKLEAKRKKTMSGILLVGLLSCLGLFMYGLYTSQYLVISMSIIAAIMLFFFRTLSPYKIMMVDLEEEHANLLLKQKRLTEGILTAKDEQTSYHAQQKLARDDQMKGMLDTEKMILKQKESMYDKVIRSFESWEENWFDINEQVKMVKNEYHLLDDATGNQLDELFLLIGKIKEHIHKRNGLEMKHATVKDDIEKNTKTIAEVASSLNTVSSSEDDVITRMKQLLHEEKDKQITFLNLQKKLSEIDEELSLITNETGHLTNECMKLYEQAEVATEEDFRAKGKYFEEGKELTHQLSLIEGQLSYYGFETVGTKEELDDVIQKHMDQLHSLKKQDWDIQAALSDTNHQLSLLEEGGEYSTILQTFTLEKSQLQELFRKWAVYKVAHDMLTKTVNVFKNERLPAIMKTLEKNLFILTNGEYHKVFAPKDEETFIVERHDGVRFTPDELSQATAEQLYIGLRFALSTNMQTTETYPIIIDDSFVNFDKARTESAFRLIRELSGHHQIFFFSCHNHLEDYFDADEVIHLDEVLNLSYHE